MIAQCNNMQHEYMTVDHPEGPERRLRARWFLVAGCVTLYAVYMVHKLGVRAGVTVTYLTWCFLVLGTPVADAGGLLDVPVRLLTGIPMVWVEVCVIATSILSCAAFVWLYPEAFKHTALLRAFHIILTNPVPYWAIIVVCIIGTILSVRIGDLVIDKAQAAMRQRSWQALVAGWTWEASIDVVVYAAVWWYYIVAITPLFGRVMKSRNPYTGLIQTCQRTM
jgi:hypothetical protein